MTTKAWGDFRYFLHLFMCLLGSGLRLHLYSLTAKGQQQSRELIFKGGFHRRVGVTFAARKGSEKEKARRSLSSPAMCLDRADSAKALFPPPQCSWSGGSGEGRKPGDHQFLGQTQTLQKNILKENGFPENCLHIQRTYEGGSETVWQTAAVAAAPSPIFYERR